MIDFFKELALKIPKYSKTLKFIYELLKKTHFNQLITLLNDYSVQKSSVSSVNQTKN